MTSTNIALDFTIDNVQLEIDIYYEPERPAPPCSNPSSPNFSDSGDSEYIEIINVYLKLEAKKFILPEEVGDYINNNYIETITKKAREIYEETRKIK